MTKCICIVKSLRKQHVQTTWSIMSRNKRGRVRERDLCGNIERAKLSRGEGVEG